MPPSEGSSIMTIKQRIAACLLSLPNKDSYAKSSTIECAKSCSTRCPSPGPITMPRPTTAPIPPNSICTMPPHMVRTRPAQRTREPRRRTESQERHLVTIESEAWLEMLAKQWIAFMDWEPPVTKWYSRKAGSSPTSSVDHDGGGGGGKGRKMSEDGHITVQVPRRQLPGQQKGLTYIRYYRTRDGKPATRE